MDIQTKIRYSKMIELSGNCEKKIILDVGAGKNPVSNQIKTKKTIKMDGCKEHNPDIECNINEGFPLEDDSIDLVLAGEIIEHLVAPIRFVRECNRVLKKGGMVVISTPNIASLKNRIKLLFNILPEGCAEPLEDESFQKHIVDFTIPKLCSIFKKEGFRINKKTSNGIISHGKLLFPLFLTPASFGQTMILQVIKN